MNIILGRSFLSVKLIIKRENKTIAIPALENDSNRHSDDIHNEITIRTLSFLSLKTVLQYNMAMIPINIMPALNIPNWFGPPDIKPQTRSISHYCK